MNKELLLKVRDAILAEPEHFDMEHFVRRNTSCGTTACIAGWTVALSRNTTPDADETIPDSISVAWEAQSRLGLTHEQEVALFYADDWPEPFRAQYDDAYEPAELACIAAGRIDHFIATEGRE